MQQANIASDMPLIMGPLQAHLQAALDAHAASAARASANSSGETFTTWAARAAGHGIGRQVQQGLRAAEGGE